MAGIMFVSYAILPAGEASYEERLAWGEPLTIIDIDEFPILNPTLSECVWMIPGSHAQMVEDMRVDDERDAILGALVERITAFIERNLGR